MKLSDTDKSKIIAFLKEKMSLRLLILYGSYVSGEATDQSDIDLAFIADEDFGAYDLWHDVAQELASIMNVDYIDLVDMKKIDDVFQFVIVSTGEIIFQDGNFDTYLDLVYTKYLQLNDDRQEILQHYAG